MKLDLLDRDHRYPEPSPRWTADRVRQEVCWAGAPLDAILVAKGDAQTLLHDG